MPGLAQSGPQNHGAIIGFLTASLLSCPKQSSDVQKKQALAKSEDMLITEVELEACNFWGN